VATKNRRFAPLRTGYDQTVKATALTSKKRAIPMLTQEKSEQVLWMADCYNLAKRFQNPRTWMSLLEPADPNLNPFQYWLWMEIWKASHSEPVADQTPKS